MSDPVLKEFRFIGSHAEDLEGGRPVEPGEFTGPIDVNAPKNAQLIEDGLLIEGTAPKDEDEAPPKLTGAELNARAKELGIEGYSTLRAEELRAAVENAEAKAKDENNENGGTT